MMKLASALTVLWLLNGCAAQPSNVDRARIAQEVHQRFDSLAEAARELDTQNYLDHFDSTAFTALNADGTVTGSFNEFRQAYIAGTAQLAAYESLRFDPVQVSIVGPHTAVLINEYEARLTLIDGESVQVAGAGSQLWSKASGRWLLVSVASSVKR